MTQETPVDVTREPGFYWVLPVFDVDSDADSWRQHEQPAYWDGERWAMLDTEDWAVRWVGSRIASTRPTQADAVSVERVARIIAPTRWAVLDSYLEQTKRKYRGQNCAYDPEEFKDSTSIVTAREILTTMNTIRDADFLRDAIVNAYIAGCEAVQNNYHPYNDPCFKEAAYDYASEALAEGD